MSRVPALLLLNVSLVAMQEPDILVYGATPAGIVGAEDGEKCCSSGRRIASEDVDEWAFTLRLPAFESLAAAFPDFSKRAEAHYIEVFGADAPQQKTSAASTVNRRLTSQ